MQQKNTTTLQELIGKATTSGVFYGVAASTAVLKIPEHVANGMHEQPISWFMMNAIDKFFTTNMPVGYQTAAAWASISLLIGAGGIYQGRKANRLTKTINNDPSPK